MLSFYLNNVLGPRMVDDILHKVDDTLVITVESEFFLPNSQLTGKLLQPNYLLADFCCGHVLGFLG